VLRRLFAGAVDRRHPHHSLAPGPWLARPTIVISPHQDDETLACGGTIVAKRRAGARVTIVFLMDGSRSHHPMMGPEELSSVRCAEALAAAARLGVGAADVVFVGLPEGKLGRFVPEATEQLLEVFRARRPEEVFTPSALEPKEEHALANLVTRAALDRWDHEVVVNEYPVWCWYHWPRVPIPLSRRSVRRPLRVRREAPRVLSNTRLMRCGARLASEFPAEVDVSGELGTKRAALDEYRSQMTRLLPDPRWATLDDVGAGTFLDCFFTGRERFRRYVYRPRGVDRVDRDHASTERVST
jgi:LmbE family N-acetylglucosaminyl deacetylase